MDATIQAWSRRDFLKKAVTACADAGIGLTAMKTVANESRDRFQGAPRMTESEIEQLTQLTGQFLNKGFTDIQDRLIAVWQNPHITSICSYMPSMTVLESNVSAALNAEQRCPQKMAIGRHMREAAGILA